MKIIKYNLIILIIISLISCDVDYFENPNETSKPPTSGLFNDATKKIIDISRNEWFAGRFTLTTMQYWAQVNYTEEDRYQYRDNVSNWDGFYQTIQNYKLIIIKNTDKSTKDIVTAYGPNEGQIAVSRIMLSYAFNILADNFGDIPYYSYGSNNEDFQGLNADNNILKPKYSAQKDVFLDILKELSEASKQLEAVSNERIKGDPIYNGDLSKWKKFANSLRMRVAMKIMGTSEEAVAKKHIADAISSGVFTSNADNAMLEYENDATNGAPMYKAYYVSNRTDFAVSYPFVTLLKGDNLATTTPKVNPFKGLKDPRLEVFVAPNSLGDYVGQPYGVESKDAAAFKWHSLPGKDILKADFAVSLMDYSEVEFILSEYNNWDESHYKKAVEASLDRWGISADKKADYISSLPSANKERVLTQKYIALYMQSHTAWTEYRRTGYPKFLIMPNESYTESVITDDKGKEDVFNYTFVPMVKGITDIPYRVTYPNEEQNLNLKNYKEAVSKLDKGDVITSKLWWMNR